MDNDTFDKIGRAMCVSGELSMFKGLWEHMTDSESHEALGCLVRLSDSTPLDFHYFINDVQLAKRNILKRLYGGEQIHDFTINHSNPLGQFCNRCGVEKDG